MTRFVIALALLASTAFAETGVVIDFEKVLKESTYGYRAREAAAARTKDKTPEEKRKAESEEYEKVYKLAFPLLTDFAKRQKLDFVFLKERGVMHADPLLCDLVTTQFISALDRHSSDPKATFDTKPTLPTSWVLRVAVMNPDAVFGVSKLGKDTQAKMKQQFEKAQAELDGLQNEAKELGKKLETQKEGTPEYDKAKTALQDKLRSAMTIKGMRDYELDFFRKKAIEEVMEATEKAASAVAAAQGYSVVLSGEDARVVAAAPGLDVTSAVIAAVDAPEEAAKKKTDKAQKPSAIATVGFRQLWGELEKKRADAKPGTEIPVAGSKFLEPAGLQLILDEEILVYANPARSRTADLSKKLNAAE